MPKLPTARKMVPRKPKRAEQSEHAAQEERPDRSDQWEERVREIARVVFEEMIQTMRTIPHPISVSDLPRPKREGRKESRRYRKITVTLDETLFEELQRRAEAERTSFGKALDAILWVAFGRPKLSYHGEGSERDKSA